MLDWLIIGGGPHGIHVGVRLAGRRTGAEGRVAVLDPHPDPLHAWRSVTTGLGMTYLRSPVVHHVGLRSLELVEFADRQRHALTRPPFKGRYRRPSLELFDAHAAHCAREAGLTDGWRVGRAERLTQTRRGWRVETDRGALQARRVVLGVGASGRLHRPSWASDLGDRVDHVLDPGRRPIRGGPVLVVGGGLSAAQAAMGLADRRVEVTLVSRHPPRIHRFDAAPGWLGPKRMRGFRAEADAGRRREMIRRARHRGSLTSDAHHALRAMERRGALRVISGEVVAARQEPGGVQLRVDGGDRGHVRLRVQRVLLATGYAPDASSPPWITELALDAGLPLAPCGTPLPDRALQWAPGLHLTGPLAELELGPVARNLAGARRAGEVIAAVDRLTGRGAGGGLAVGRGPTGRHPSRRRASTDPQGEVPGVPRRSA